MPTKMTKQDRIAMERLKYHTWLMDRDDWNATMALYEIAPSAWHTITADLDCHEPKEKLTLYLDKSVARTFKAMGKGYQGRINRILQTWLAMKMANQFETYAKIHDHQGDMLERRKTMSQEGQSPKWITEPGEVPPTEEPPEVDW